MKYLIVGLGNIGDDYAHTRHNIGFDVVDALVEKYKSAFTADRYADIAEISLRGRQIIAIKPNTYMNLSGKAVRYWMQAHKIPVENIFVIVDDLAIPF
jgi:PTH1 family peptidyl-tRNA hydrolase